MFLKITSTFLKINPFRHRQTVQRGPYCLSKNQKNNPISIAVQLFGVGFRFRQG